MSVYTNMWYVNRSGSGKPVYAEPELVTRIGTILPNEAFATLQEVTSSYASILFYASDGQLKIGYMAIYADGTYRRLDNCCKLYWVDIGETIYAAFKIQNRGEEIYNNYGYWIRNLPVGSEIAVYVPYSGNHFGKPADWMQIRHYRVAGEANWNEVYPYGFVDTGFRYGSGSAWSIDHAYN